jgi:hypothetical protein
MAAPLWIPPSLDPTMVSAYRYYVSLPGAIQDRLDDDDMLSAHHVFLHPVLNQEKLIDLRDFMDAHFDQPGQRSDRIIANLLAYRIIQGEDVKSYLINPNSFSTKAQLDNFLASPAKWDTEYTRDHSDIPLYTTYHIPVAGGRRRRASRKYKKTRRHRKSRSQKRQ